MGLAASQARMLMLTSRKSDIESKLQSRANDLLSMSRDSQKLSQEYQSALNATKLVWNDNGSNADLSYNLLMAPRSVSSNQYLLTNSRGAVILDSKYATALGISNVPEGNAGSITQYCSSAKTFAAKMMECDESQLDPVTPTPAEEQTPAPSSGGNNNSSIRFTTNYDEMDILKKAGLDAAYNGYTDLKSHDRGVNGWGGDNIGSDFDSNHVNGTSFKNDVAATFKPWLNDVVDSLKGALVSNLCDQGLGSYKKQLRDAAEWAREATYNKFVYNVDDTNSKDKSTGITAETAMVINNVGDNGDNRNNTAGNQISYAYRRVRTDAYFWDKQQDDEVHGHVYVDNSQVIDTFLSYFDRYCAQNFTSDGDTTDTDNKTDGERYLKSAIGSSSTSGATAGYQRGTAEDTEDLNAAPTPTTSTPTTQPNAALGNNSLADSSEYAYYINLYSAIFSSGWKVDANVSNKNYVQTQVEHGALNIKQMTKGASRNSSAATGTFDLSSNASWSYLSTGDSGSPLETEADDDAVTKAKAKYDAEKDKLDFKEKMMDMEMKNLDAERSEITTEIESVNSIIKDNVKSLKMFDA